MVQTIIVCVGLPGSGKSTWATKFVEEHQGWVRINKDTLRSMFYGNAMWTRTLEDFVCDVRDHLIHVSLVRGYNIIVDDTNLHEKHIIAIRAFAETHGATVQIQDFTGAPLWECIEHDRTRKDKKPVGEETILMMYRKYFEDGRWKHLDMYKDLIK